MENNLQAESIESFKREPDYIYEGEFCLRVDKWEDVVEVRMNEGELGCILFGHPIDTFDDLSWKAAVVGVGKTKDFDHIGEDQEEFRDMIKRCWELGSNFYFTVNENQVLLWFK